MAALLMVSTAAFATAPTTKPIELMVRGSYNFGNPGRDLNNIASVSVVTRNTSPSSIGSPM